MCYDVATCGWMLAVFLFNSIGRSVRYVYLPLSEVCAVKTLIVLTPFFLPLMCTLQSASVFSRASSIRVRAAAGLSTNTVTNKPTMKDTHTCTSRVTMRYCNENISCSLGEARDECL